MKGAKVKEPGHRIPSRQKLRENPCGGVKLKERHRVERVESLECS
jgi:hypothetical protein